MTELAPMTLRGLIARGAKVEERAIGKTAVQWINRLQPIPFEAWGIDPMDRVILEAIDRVWEVGLLGAEPNRLHRGDEIAAFESVPHEDKL